MYPSNHVVAYKNKAGTVRKGLVELMSHKSSGTWEQPRKIAAFRCVDGSYVEGSNECREKNYEIMTKRYVKTMMRRAGRLSIEESTKLRKAVEAAAASKYARILTGPNVNSILPLTAPVAAE
jgi:hypothetical protein